MTSSESEDIVPVDAVLRRSKLLVLGLQHVAAACATSMVAVPIVVGSALGLSAADIRLMVSAAYLSSGLSTVLQSAHVRLTRAKDVGPACSRWRCPPLFLGTGMLGVMGTSAAFIGPSIELGLHAGGGTDGMAAVLGTCLLMSLLEALLSPFSHALQRTFPPVVRGAVLIVLGVDLIRVGALYWGGGAAAYNREGCVKGGDECGVDQFGSPVNVALGATVLAVILLAARAPWAGVRGLSVAVGLVVGYCVAGMAGAVDDAGIRDADWVAAPRPLRWGLSVEPAFLFPVGVVYVVTMLESVADINATSKLSGLPLDGEGFEQRLQGGLLNDAFGSALACFFTAPPNTTYSQNSGIIMLTRVAARSVGYAAGGILFLMGLLGKVGAVMAAMPPAVMGGALSYLFANIAIAGLAIIRDAPLDKRNRRSLAAMLVTGLVVSYHPDLVRRSLWLEEDDDALDGLRAGIITALSVPYAISAVVGVAVYHTSPKEAGLACGPPVAAAELEAVLEAGVKVELVEN